MTDEQVRCSLCGYPLPHDAFAQRQHDYFVHDEFAQKEGGTAMGATTKKEALDDFMPSASTLYDKVRDCSKEEAIIHLAHALGIAYLEGASVAANEASERMHAFIEDLTTTVEKKAGQ